MTVALKRSGTTAAERPPIPLPLETEIKRYEIRDRVRVEAPTSGAEILDIWAPVIPDTPYQRVLDLEATAPAPWQIHREAEFGNLVFHSRLRVPACKPLEVEFRCLVERFPVPHRLDPALVRPVSTPQLFSRVLGLEQFVDVNDKTRSLAREIVGSETNIVLQARLLYDYVTGTMSYDAAQQSWKGSTEHALVCSVGNCNDIHALFISLARSLNIPARLVLGQAFEPPPAGQEACELCGYHCWAEFFAPGLGWIPVDASCACKYGKHALFGAIETNHVAWSVGRDILLAPAQRGARILFFAGPYTEADGRPHSAVERHVTFVDLS
ncbi:MAG: transglutaminase family protein [Bradyrhizobium sp.]|uniref:transglutaminase-like domain-containing protein n=1 Tax=Bradyrhizobium sp. TaxID=376 RepID=UPI0023866E99|nr:transglutaminase family protein [Bradyrhizobium sp.]MDE2069229.1 transglutaminase family protein [Bradyrhizobium sp.]